MKTKEELIKGIAKMIDRDKNNFLLTSRNYDKYLESILTLLVDECIKLKEKKENK